MNAALGEKGNGLEHLLRSPVPSLATPASLSDWLDHLDTCPFGSSIDRALWAGFEADRLGYAFVGGYQAALQQLLEIAMPSTALPPKRRSLAASESGGAHPRAIKTALAQAVDPNGQPRLVLRGEKTFATLASAAEELLVVATRGVAVDGRSELCLVRVNPSAPGITIENREPTPFAPEIPHARVRFIDVSVSDADVLAGDGYVLYLKPFRTIEDAHVLAAALGQIIRTARMWAFDGVVVEAAYAHAIALREVATLPPADETGHIALAGLFEGVRRLAIDHEAEWNKCDAETRDRWRRDLGLFVVADIARKARTAAAWMKLRTPAE